MRYAFWDLFFLAQGIKIEEERIEVMKTWPNRNLIKKIYIFLGFANFYKKFIRNFSKITTSFIVMLQTTPISLDSSFLVIRANQESYNRGIKDGNGVDDIVSSVSSRNKYLLNMGKLKNLAKSKNSDFAKTNSFRAYFFNLGAKKVFTYL